MKTNNLIAIIAIVAAFILGAILFRSCKDSKGGHPSVINLDSLLAANARNAKALQDFQDSADKLLDWQDRQIVALKVEKDIAQEDARKSKEKALYWAKLYKEAKSNRDTAAQLYACDSLEAEFQSYIIRVDNYFVKADSIITGQHAMIQTQQSVIDRQAAFIVSQGKTLELAQSSTAALVKENTELKKEVRKQKKWGNGKGILAGIIGVIIGSAISR
jgi:hypothetical protein